MSDPLPLVQQPRRDPKPAVPLPRKPRHFVWYHPDGTTEKVPYTPTDDTDPPGHQDTRAGTGGTFNPAEGP